MPDADTPSSQPDLNLRGFTIWLVNELQLQIDDPNPYDDICSDWDVDSLGVLELLVAVEEYAGVQCISEHPRVIRSAADAYDYLQWLLGRRPPPGATESSS